MTIYFPVWRLNLTRQVMDERTAQATPPDESGWSFSALRTAFSASLLHWMRRFRVHPSEVEDAVQDALFEAWRSLATFPADKDKARYEMLRVASRVAQRYRRRAARIEYVEALEVRDSRDVEAWIAARALWLEALLRLDERSRDLLLAYHVDGRTHKQIGADLRKKEDTIRKRVDVAEGKLRKEIEKLLGKEHDRKGLFPASGLVIVFDPFDRATIRAILDVEDEFGFDVPPPSSIRPQIATNSWPWQYVPMGLLAVALFLVPGQGWRTEALYAAKMGILPVPVVEVRSDVPLHRSENSQQEPEPLPRKTNRQDRHPLPVLSAEDAEIVKKLHEARAPVQP